MYIFHRKLHNLSPRKWQSKWIDNRFASLRKQPTFGDATTGFPAKWRLRNKRRNSILITRHYPDLGSTSDWSCRVGNLIQLTRSTTQIWVVTILGDPEAVSRERREESFQAWAEEPLGTDSHRTISKRSRECWLLIGLKKCFVLLCPIGEQFSPSSFLEFVHDVFYLATVARFVP